MKSKLVKVPTVFIKQKLAKLRYSMKDLSEATKIPYNSMNGYLNGYSNGISPHRLTLIMSKLKAWEVG